ncbi:long-chain fatty acid--CoA ligase [Pikeienuella piscinae]|uniref:Long-chain fatty acid--CoA ligase n=1 Tax=Pikeienuella piscinae TaxID=2748098 RepID=A0A7M3T6A8_9RHOB|nr:AMP-binding protein [Pikeienuella piscinae]QIE57539.1 long-chain fatty acid--CoA ligase [Pikeienuella piscinae]
MGDHVAPPEALDTLPKLLEWNATSRANAPASREKEFGIWQSFTWAEVRDEVRALALGLRTLGLGAGDRVAIIGANRPRLYWSMPAIQMCGATPVPVYQDSVAEEMQFVLEHAGVRFAIVEDQEQVDKVLSVGDKLPDLERIVYSDPRGLRKYDHERLHRYDEVQKAGRAAEAEHGAEIDALIATAKGSDTCIILYTSGTTGKPKGVVLSNDNILSAARSSAVFDDLRQTDSVLAYLPMAWVGDFIFSVGQAYVCGFSVACPESPDTMLLDLREIGPSYYFAPPRIYESLLTTVMIRMEDAGRLKRWLFNYFMKHAEDVGPKILDGRAVGLLDRLKYRLGDILIYGPLKNTLGMSNIRLGYTAGEAIGPEIFRFYRALGINLKQLYGQTEASVFITAQPNGEVRADTVGTPTPGVELRIDEKGEVWYRSPGVFVEYYRQPEKTAETKDKDGWVATGDAGFIEKETGHLRIIDRAKDVGKMADGGLFAPKYVENKLKYYPNILEAVVFGAGRDRCSAFLNIDLGSVGNWAERNNIAYGSYTELAQHPKVYEMMRSHVDEVNRSLAADEMLSGCQIHRFLVLHKQLDADDGELTRTQKVRRPTITERYEPLIEALYSDAEEVFAETEVTYEDGRKGKISAVLKIADMEAYPPVRKAAA